MPVGITRGDQTANSNVTLPSDAVAIGVLESESGLNRSTIVSAFKRYPDIFTAGTVVSKPEYFEAAGLTLNVTYIARSAFDAWRKRLDDQPNRGGRRAGGGKRVNLRISAEAYDAAMSAIKAINGVQILESKPRAKKEAADASANGAEKPAKRGRKAKPANADTAPVPLGDLFESAPVSA